VRLVTLVLAVIVVALVLSSLYGRWRPRLPQPLKGGGDHIVRVQVLNGSGESGIGARVASSLREGGFQVVEIENADRSDYFATMVVARRADVAGAEAVAGYLGGLPVIRQTWDSELAEVTVVVGSDRSRLRLD
jgi:LytR cell envelope-related transcriptional attenuator